MRAALPLLLALAPTPALADATCRFVTECVDDAPCTASDYAFTLEMKEMAATLVTPSASIEGRLGVTPDGATYALAVGDGGVHLLTVLGDTARYTVHLPGAGLAITYLGTCGTE